MKIIVITGAGGSGKDAFVNACRKEVSTECLSTIDPVKTLLNKAKLYKATPVNIGLSIVWRHEVKGPKERALLSAMKNALTEYGDIPYRDTVARIMQAKAGGCKLCFIMVREFPEIQRFVHRLNAETMLVTMPGLTSCATEAEFMAMVPYGYEFDHVITNDAGLKELAAKADEFVRTIYEQR